MSDLDKLDFGLGAAQQEQHLGNYFYRSGAFKLACSDKIYLILGAKGAGKSAIFKMFRELESEIAIFAKPNLCVRDDPLLRDHYATLQTLENASLATLWRFYMASLIADRCLKESDLPEALRRDYGRFLARWGLVREVPTAWQAMKHLRVEVGLGEYLVFSEAGRRAMRPSSGTVSSWMLKPLPSACAHALPMRIEWLSPPDKIKTGRARLRRAVT